MTSRAVMRAIRVSQFGGPEVLKVETNVAVPVPSDTQVTFYSQVFHFQSLINNVTGKFVFIR